MTRSKSVAVDDATAKLLSDLSKKLKRSRRQIVRDAIALYRPYILRPRKETRPCREAS